MSSILEREHLDASLHLVHSPDGKPLLYSEHEPSPIAVALSHSRAIAACAITDRGAIGIDVEFRADRPFQALAATAFGPAEQRAVAREGRSAFYRIWTLREALAKAPLDGLARLTDGRDYFADAPSMGSRRTVIDNQEWLFWTEVLPDNYAIALALAPLSPSRLWFNHSNAIADNLGEPLLSVVNVNSQPCTAATNIEDAESLLLPSWSCPAATKDYTVSAWFSRLGL